MDRVKVLILENSNEPENFESQTGCITTALSERGFSVLPIETKLKDGINSLIQNKPNIVVCDLALMDQQAEFDSLGALIEKSDIPLIYLSDPRKPELIKKALATKPFSILTKPVAENNLSLSIQVALVRLLHELKERQKATQLPKVYQNKGDSLLPIKSFIHDTKRPLKELQKQLSTYSLENPSSKELSQKCDLIVSIYNQFSDSLMGTEKEDKKQTHLKSISEDIRLMTGYSVMSKSFKINIQSCDTMIQYSHAATIRLLLTLINNTLDHAKVKEDEKWIDITFKKSDRNGIDLLYRDSGLKIPQEVSSQMFQQNFSTRSDTDNSGLGLFTIHHELEAMGHSITYDEGLFKIHFSNKK